MDESFGIFILFVAFCIGLVSVVNNLMKADEAPRIYFQAQPGTDRGRGYAKEILRRCPVISEKYSPPAVWGRSGHLQTFVHVLLAQTSQFQYTATSRESVRLSDGSTVYYDVFDPLPDAAEPPRDLTVLVLPGLGATSEGVYLKRFAYYANQRGYRVVIMNHLGFLPSHPLTSYRIFTHGSTEEVDAVTLRLMQTYPHTGLIGLGQSLGANILMKYLGEASAHQGHFLAAVSICQGYDIKRCISHLEGDRVGQTYLSYLLHYHLEVIKRFQHLLFSATSPFSDLRAADVLECKSFKELVDTFVLKATGHRSYEDYLRRSSSSQYMQNISIPMLMVNAEDDPLIPAESLQYAKRLVERSANAILVVSKHGGHLGFYEYSGSRANNPSSSIWELEREPSKWLDRLLLQFVGECGRVLPVHGVMDKSGLAASSACSESS